ncbi:unnamed protein product [Sphagnum jensenii]|uniref:Uncharacterized protein n=1 Tax=Sphagnum jensenii TaxID=128206 RepID=A0ABP1BG06_9BRYO
MELRVICSMQDLWVIYDLLKAKRVILESVDSHSGAVGADITTVVPIGRPAVGANRMMSATKKTLFECTVPDNNVRAFGFRAIHARGQQQSENIDRQLDLGGLLLKPPADMQDDNGDDIECFEIVASNLAEEPDK